MCSNCVDVDDREVIFLYNGALLDEDGNSAVAIPRLFHSNVVAAQIWIDQQGYDARVVRGQRVGDKLIEADAK